MTPPPADNLAARVFLGPALRAQPDRRLVDLVRDGYDAAFEEIVRRYRRPLDRFAAAIVGGRSEDVTQDAFSKALPALRGSEVEIELRPWLYRIVRNTALNDLRDSPPAAAELSETIAGARSAAAEVETREELADLMERLRALPEPQRAALVMRELEGLSHEEIAAALGVSGGAARQAIYRARATLRNGLGLLLPLPLLRALAESGGEAAAGSAIAVGAGASAAGGTALGGLSGGAAKVGVAVLIAGSVGAGVAVERQDGGNRGPEAAQAAPASPGIAQRSGDLGGSDGPGLGSDPADDRSGGGDNDSSGPGSGDDERRDQNRGHEDHSDDGRSRSDDDSERSDSSGHGGPGPSRNSGESDDDFDDRSGSSGSGTSGSGGSGSSGGDDFELDDSSGPGSDEVEIETIEPVTEDSSGSGSSDDSDSAFDNSGSADD